MKKTSTALVVIVICLAELLGQVRNPSSKQPAKWSLAINTGGAPWEKKFDVELNQSGKLVVTENKPLKMPKNTVTNLTVNLSAKVSREIYEQALKAFEEPRAERKVKLHDGTNLTFQLTENGHERVIKFFHIGMIQDESQAIAKVLSLINKHLPKEHQVY